MSTSENNKRIAQNAFFLYLRMFLSMGVSLFTARVILQALGVEDFGIYNVVAGIVVLFSFINGAMAIASQRFLSFAIGEGTQDKVGKVFSMSLTSHFFMAIIVLALAETIGLWIVGGMNFPIGRYDAAAWAYHFAVFTCIINVVRVPYNAAIIAYEKMSFYAWISIVEVFAKLGIAYSLMIYSGDKLIFYSFLLFLVTMLVNLIYKWYCNHLFSATKYHFFWDKSMFRQFVSFSGWSLAGSLANVGAQQGLTMILNLFCGVLVNAASGIAGQVTGAVGVFLSNFQTAFNPQLVKSYASGDCEYFMNLIFKSSKFSYYLLFIISLPVLINCSFFIDVWLGNVPQYAVEFTQLMVIFLLFDAISGPLWVSVQATGKIKNYQLLMSFLILLNLPVSYLLLKYGCSPIYVFVGRVVINIVTLFARIVYLRPLIQLPARKFVIQVLFPILIVTAISAPLPIWLNGVWDISWHSVIIISLVAVLLSSVVIYIVGLTAGERIIVNKLVKNKLVSKIH